ncbi:MAG: membrane protein insertase YidC [Gemmatimonadetes bacterium]|nr:membrane protein insertase YidC [Gemmatimonadota bacterium]
MKTEARFLIAIVLMLAVLVGTNRLFPPVVPEDVGPVADSTAEQTEGAGETPSALPSDTGAPAASGEVAVPPSPDPELPGSTQPTPEVAPPTTAEVVVSVSGPLYEYRFSSLGARIVSGELSEFESLRKPGPVGVVPDGTSGYFGHRLVVGSDTLDLSNVPFTVEPADGLQLVEGGDPETLRFTYTHPSGQFDFRVEYTFDPDDYTLAVRGGLRGVDRALMITDMGAGLPFAEADSAIEARSMAYVFNHLQDGIRSTTIEKAEPPTIVEGPLVWAAFRSKFFVLAMLAGESDELASDANYLGGLFVREAEVDERVRVGAAQTVTEGAGFAYRMFVGPQEYALLSSLGQGMEEVNPYGWRFFRPIIRPFVSVIMTILVFLHTQLSLGYGWVLIVFGVLMRVVFFPLYHKSMKAQLRNMAVQPLVKEIQDRYKDQPEKLQKELMKLYKEHGFNPLAGCLPMLLPWPVLIALFFVFQNTIELRGVEFLWLPDLSAKDPFYILPILLALSMFLMQWVSLRSLDQENPQMKMMMYIMPPMMLFIFMNLPSGLNLYYATANIATLPQQVWIARERAKMKDQPPLKISRE